MPDRITGKFGPESYNSFNTEEFADFSEGTEFVFPVALELQTQGNVVTLLEVPVIERSVWEGKAPEPTEAVQEREEARDASQKIHSHASPGESGAQKTKVSEEQAPLPAYRVNGGLIFKDWIDKRVSMGDGTEYRPGEFLIRAGIELKEFCTGFRCFNPTEAAAIIMGYFTYMRNWIDQIDISKGLPRVFS